MGLVLMASWPETCVGNIRGDDTDHLPPILMQHLLTNKTIWEIIASLKAIKTPTLELHGLLRVRVCSQAGNLYTKEATA